MNIKETQKPSKIQKSVFIKLDDSEICLEKNR
jgi:hypothetical protein